MTQMWSLATEVAFYILLPILIWVMVGRTKSTRAGPATTGGSAVNGPSNGVRDRVAIRHKHRLVPS
jgi:peptidoglycan/LPS O-acetylase OafA/YrhL